MLQFLVSFPAFLRRFPENLAKMIFLDNPFKSHGFPKFLTKLIKRNYQKEPFFEIWKILIIEIIPFPYTLYQKRILHSKICLSLGVSTKPNVLIKNLHFHVKLLETTPGKNISYRNFLFCRLSFMQVSK